MGGVNGPYGSHAKFREYKSIEISPQIYSDFLDNQPKQLHWKVRGQEYFYSLPAVVFKDPQNWRTGKFLYNTVLLSE